MRRRRRSASSGSRPTFFGTFPANPYPWQTGLAPKYPLVESLPATVVNGQSWRIAEVGQDYGREYLGRSVVELNGPDRITWLPSVANHKTANSITLQIKDIVSGVSSAGDIINAMQTGGYGPCWWLYHFYDTVVFVIKDVLTGDFQADIQIPSLFDGSLHEFKVEFSDLEAKLIVDGVTKLTISLVGKTLYNCEYIRVQDGSTGIRPLQICNIKQSLNGTLIDNIPCDESTGTTLRNTVNEDRPATLSDANAHALAWVPQDSVTMARWVWEDGAWVLQDNWLVTDEGVVLNSTGGQISVNTYDKITIDRNGMIKTDLLGNIILEK